MRKIIYAFVVVGVPFLLSCGLGDESPVLQSQPEFTKASFTILKSARENKVRGPGRTAQQINDANPMGWVGRVHNSFQMAVVAEFQKNGGRPCDVYQKVLTTGEYYGADSVHLPRAERGRHNDAALTQVRCPTRTVSQQGDSLVPQLIRTAGLVATKSSGDPVPYLEAIEEALESSYSATDYAQTIDAIVALAEQELSGSELEAVQGGASLAVSSASYWESNAVSDYYAMEPYFESQCQNQPPDPCNWETAFPIRDSLKLVPTFMLASTVGKSTLACTDLLHWKNIATPDIVVGVGATIATMNPGAGLAAGTTASGFAFIVAGIATLGCLWAQ